MPDASLKSVFVADIDAAVPGCKTENATAIATESGIDSIGISPSIKASFVLIGIFTVLGFNVLAALGEGWSCNNET